MMQKKEVNIRDIARACNVSPATVSLVINNHPRISAKTRNLVLKKIKEMDYYPNIIAQRLSKRTSKTLAVVVPEIKHLFNDYYFAESLSGTYDTALKYGYEILLKVGNEDFVLNKIYIRLFKEARIDGMVYIGSTFDDTYLKEFEKLNYPFVLVNSYLKRSKVSYVKGDAVKGGYLATKHLIDRGHKNIGFLSGSWNVSTTVDKFKGYKKALKEAGITFKEEFVFTGDFTQLSGFHAVEEMMEKGVLKKITAIFCNNDLMAVGAVDKLNSLGIKVPDNIAIVGFDNNPISELYTPKITTIFIPVYEIASTSCEYIINNVLSRKKFVPIRKTLPVKLIVRESS